MKKFYIPILVLIILICFGACEKDDICIDGDTPLLVIRFYNVDNPTVIKKVTKLRIVGVGQNTTVTTVSDRTDLDSIAIPLKVTENSTGFYFIRNSADVETTDSGGETITVGVKNLIIIQSLAKSTVGITPPYVYGIVHAIPISIGVVIHT